MYILSEFVSSHGTNKTSNQKSDFLRLITRKWDEVHDQTDVFRYKINNIQEKVVNGYILQLNPDRSSKRRKPEQIDNICQPFDSAKFNFTQVSQEEVLFTFKKDVEDTDIHSIIVNVSPISRYHSLICPSLDKCLPQVITLDSLELTLRIMFLVNERAFRIGFNSLCGLASVNHLHYHTFLENHVLPVGKCECYHLQGPVYCLSEDYPVPGFCFEIPCTSCLIDSSKEIYKLLQYLLKNSIAHNIFITKGQGVEDNEKEVVRVVVWPRKSSVGVKQLTAFNVAVLELSGWFPVFNADDYEKLQHQDLENELTKWRIDNFKDLCGEIKILFQ